MLKEKPILCHIGASWSSLIDQVDLSLAPINAPKIRVGFLMKLIARNFPNRSERVSRHSPASWDTLAEI